MYSTEADDIKQRMLNRISSDIDKNEGGFVASSVVASAEEFSSFSDRLDEVLLKVFAKSAAANGYSDELDNRAADFGLARKVGTKSQGTVIFTCVPGAIIPIGTIVETESALQFATLAAVTAVATAETINVEAVDVGIVYNVKAGEIKRLANPIVDVSAVMGNVDMLGGTGVETDVDFYDRLQTKVSRPSTSGNANDYFNWATEVAGVGMAKVVPLWNGSGTVKVVIIDQNKAPASAPVVAAALANINLKRPIGAAATVVSATPLTINVTADVTKKQSHTAGQVTSNVIAAIDAFIKTAAFRSDYVSYAQMVSTILDSAGVSDVANVKINTGTTNVAIGADQVAIKGTVTLNVT